MRSEFARLAREVTAAGRTVFWSSHELDEVQRLADRVAIIKQGRLIATETVEHLRASTPRPSARGSPGPSTPRPSPESTGCRSPHAMAAPSSFR